MSYRAKIMRRKMGETHRQAEAKAENQAGKRAAAAIREARGDIERAFALLDSLPDAAIVPGEPVEQPDGSTVIPAPFVQAEAARILAEAAGAKGAATRARNQAFTEVTAMRGRGVLSRLIARADSLADEYENKRAAAIARIEALTGGAP